MRDIIDPMGEPLKIVGYILVAWERSDETREERSRVHFRECMTETNGLEYRYIDSYSLGHLIQPLPYEYVSYHSLRAFKYEVHIPLPFCEGFVLLLFILGHECTHTTHQPVVKIIVRVFYFLTRQLLTILRNELIKHSQGLDCWL